MEFFIFLFDYLQNDIPTFAFLAVCMGVIYYFLFRKQVYSLFDPLLIQLFSNVISASTVIFCFLKGIVEYKFLVSFILTELALFAGFFVFKPISAQFPTIPPQPLRISLKITSAILFRVAAFLFIVFQLYSYKQIGIPLFSDKSRLTLYEGTGYIFYIIGTAQFITIYLLIDKLFRKDFFVNQLGNLFFNVTVLLFTVLTFILSGSKSNLLSLIVAIFAYVLYSPNLGISSDLFEKVRSKLKLLFIASVFFSIMIISITAGTNLGNSILMLLYRIVGYGDIYVMAYHDTVLQQIDPAGSFNYLFGGNLFSFLNHFLFLDIYRPKVLGFQITEIIYGDDLGTGPNARHNIFGYIFYGWAGAILFSFILGLLLGFFRNKLYSKLPKNIFGSLIYAILFIQATALPSDAPFVFNELFYTLLMFAILFTISYLLAKMFLISPAKSGKDGF
ncbi:O-antigen polymerase [Chitinophaga barathri]|uniref:Oligosaccharide repeat unit polymerase n=1 Tax=Chitinophaga barathri TaxID=1647451 RepID=A0A3N4MYI1_9BACT|nr:O-antigen polymerase [Chitinophaga barathri]RPD40483.1 hypothetical protein EG028_14350 [Chitinophaga barathri]